MAPVIALEHEYEARGWKFNNHNAVDVGKLATSKIKAVLLVLDLLAVLAW